MIRILVFSYNYPLARGIAQMCRDVQKDLIWEIVQNKNDFIKASENTKYDYVFMDCPLWDECLDQCTLPDEIIIFGTPKCTSKARNFINTEQDRDLIYSLLEQILTIQKEENSVLSAREEEIIKLVALGNTNKEIADKLFLSIHTVITHRKNIANKLGIRTISGLTVYAILNGLVSVNEVSDKI